MSEWQECKLGDVAKLINGFAFKGSDFLNSGVPVIKIKNVKPGKILLDNLSYVSVLIASEKEKYLINSSDILITMSGNRSDGSPDSWVGKVSLFKVKGQYLLNQRVGILRPIINPISIEYLAFLLSSMEYQQHFINLANSSGGQANISPETILNTKIELPSLAEQRAIAGVLSSLDDKIDLLHRQNKTLEGMAEALWRKMFVVEVSGWQRGKLGDLVELCYGKGLKEEKRTLGVYPVFGSNGVVGYHNEFLVEGPGIVIGRKGTLGVVNYVEDNFFPIDTTFYIKSKTNTGKLFFEYFLLKEFAFEDMNSDSAVPGLNREIAESMELLIPKQKLIMAFNEFCEPLFTKKMKNHRQIRTLSRLRDTLLPKLMSGEVRVELEELKT